MDSKFFKKIRKSLLFGAPLLLACAVLMMPEISRA